MKQFNLQIGMPGPVPQNVLLDLKEDTGGINLLLNGRPVLRVFETVDGTIRFKRIPVCDPEPWLETTVKSSFDSLRMINVR